MRLYGAPDRNIVEHVARMSAAICGAWHDPGYRFAHPGYESGAHEHSRGLRLAGWAYPAGAAEPAARAGRHDGVGSDKGDQHQPDRQLGPAGLRGRHRSGPLPWPQQFYPQRAGCDPACAGRQLRKLYAHAGRPPCVASDPRRRSADRGRTRVEAPAPDAGAGLHAARGVDARSVHAGGDRRDHRQAQGRQQRARRSARGDAAA